MILVVDANVLFAALIKESSSYYLFFEDNLELYAPEFLFEELDKYKYLIQKKSSRSIEDVEQAISILKNKINIVPYSEIQPFIKTASKICPDKNDIQYFALALKLNCAIWSNDKQLKQQNIIKVYDTEELVNGL